MGRKNPKSGNMGVRFPPEHRGLDVALGAAMRTAWVRAAPFQLRFWGGGSESYAPHQKKIPPLPPDRVDFGAFWDNFCPEVNSPREDNLNKNRYYQFPTPPPALNLPFLPHFPRRKAFIFGSPIPSPFHPIPFLPFFCPFSFFFHFQESPSPPFFRAAIWGKLEPFWGRFRDRLSFPKASSPFLTQFPSFLHHDAQRNLYFPPILPFFPPFSSSIFPSTKGTHRVLPNLNSATKIKTLKPPQIDPKPPLLPPQNPRFSPQNEPRAALGSNLLLQTEELSDERRAAKNGPFSPKSEPGVHGPSSSFLLFFFFGPFSRFFAPVLGSSVRLPLFLPSSRFLPFPIDDDDRFFPLLPDEIRDGAGWERRDPDGIRVMGSEGSQWDRSNGIGGIPMGSE
ncbi:uncharacterized protein LOC110391804 [Numida meleagris]|uniref:uncharacterized protein LOC110391804 n=1 Tax=Numida meleagris TaxID=8996 RepID=UPI000B3E1992|nr:uncharacterized protein LOC110391804 [Numida meleagris]